MTYSGTLVEPMLARRNRVLAFAAVVMIGAAVATMVVDSKTASAILNLVVLLGLPTAGVLFIRRSRSLEISERRAWRLVGSGLIITSIGVVLLTITWMVTSSVDAFSPIDFIYLAGYLVGLAGFALLPHTHGSGLVRLRLLLDGIIGAVAVGSLLWVLWLDEIAASLADVPLLDRFVGSTYVLLDIALLVVLMIVVVRRSSLRFDQRLVLFGLASVSQAIADVSFLTSGAGRQFADAEPLYPMNIAAVAFFLAAALVVDRVPREREYADRTRTPAWALVLPYGFALALVGLLVVRFSQTGASATDQSLFYAAVAIAGLVILRQAVAIRENRRSVEDQRSALVGSISHELRTPLTAMVGFLEILDAGEYVSETERAEMTSIVAEQASYLSRVVSDLIMLASDSIANVKLNISPTPLDELAWSSVNVAMVDTTKVRIEADRRTTAYVDRGRITQALVNLLANAERYGGDRISVVATAVGGDLVLEVHDDGPGVPRKHELVIWERFERGDNRLNARVPGSGIGLPVTNAIAMAHGGSAGYRRSDRLGGACFWIRLPGRVQVGKEVPLDLSTKRQDRDARTA